MMKQRAHGIITHCRQRPAAFLLKETRGATVRYFIEPGTVAVQREHAEEAIASGWLIPRDLDLLGTPMTWRYSGPTKPNSAQLANDRRAPCR
jgi:hypothetical protein